jgi:hypothetical protein
LRNPHSSVSTNNLLAKLVFELLIVIRSTSPLSPLIDPGDDGDMSETGDCGAEDSFFGWTSSKSIPLALTVSSKSRWLTGLGSARDPFLGVFEILDEKLNDDDLAEGGRDGVEVFGWSIGVIDPVDRTGDFVETVGVDIFLANILRLFELVLGVAGSGGASLLRDEDDSLLLPLNMAEENDLDLGRAARKPGLGPAMASSDGSGWG